MRSDLFHRLTAYPIHVPALRERENDVALLAGYFIEQIRRKLGLQKIKFASGITQYLKLYSWPGNVRELEHTINRAALKASTDQSSSIENKALVVIELSHIGQLTNDISENLTTNIASTTATQVKPSDSSLATTLNLSALSLEAGIKSATDDFQRQLISAALDQNEGNWSAAARQLKTDRANLSRMAKRLGVAIIKTVKH